MNRLMSTIMVAGLAVALFASPALAGHKKAEKTGEAASGKMGRFAKMDADGNGSISFAEFKAYHKEHAGKHGKKSGQSKHNKAGKGKHKADKSGKKHSLQSRFDRRDQDHDGAITKAEWRATKKHHGKHGDKASDTVGKKHRART